MIRSLSASYVGTRRPTTVLYGAVFGVSSPGGPSFPKKPVLSRLARCPGRHERPFQPHVPRVPHLPRKAGPAVLDDSGGGAASMDGFGNLFAG